MGIVSISPTHKGRNVIARDETRGLVKALKTIAELGLILVQGDIP
ncbi:hypothetical protein ADICYQ_3372 [Cyclobacterium qasimii M12-11B]|uniref:Uncharacterized protein n=1 Tax=Cyclobacterium qasimii M12-11B TaxID=641524 RepID=S7WLH1_9BACT|nr:hypothetical protein ADICYQ_3372 [Cyclobacterium qasimii M12-11B]